MTATLGHIIKQPRESNLTEPLPAGYINLGYMAVPVQLLRRFTSDTQRFVRLFPVAEAYSEIGDEQRAGFVLDNCKTVADFEDLAMTLSELGALLTFASSEAKANRVRVRA